MIKQVCTKIPFLLLISFFLSLSVVISGCSGGDESKGASRSSKSIKSSATPTKPAPPSEDTKKSETTSSVPATAPAGSDILAKIEKASSFLVLGALQDGYRKNGPKSDSIDQAFGKKWKALTAGMAPKTLIEGFDVLAVDTKATGPKELTFSFLLHTTADIHTDYHLTVWGKVAPNHVPLIKEFKKGSHSTEWNLCLFDKPTSQWKSDEYRVVQLEVPSEIIPYELKIRLHTRDKNRVWTSSPGNYVILGWQTALAK